MLSLACVACETIRTRPDAPHVLLACLPGTHIRMKQQQRSRYIAYLPASVFSSFVFRRCLRPTSGTRSLRTEGIFDSVTVVHAWMT